MSETYADTFRRIVEEEKAAIKAEQEEKRLAREAAHKRLKDTRRAAQTVRDRIIYPMLTTLRESFTEAKVPLDWEVKPVEDHDEFFVVLTGLRENAKPGTLLADWEAKPTKENDDFLPANSTKSHGSRKKFSIKAGIAVVDGGPAVSMSVILPKGFNSSDVVVNTKNIVELQLQDGQCDQSDVALWYQTQLEECVRKCVRLAAEEEQP
jgi:hypothetical protein